MNKEKRIEEMAKDMCEYYYKGACYQDKKPCDCKCEIFTDARYLYAKGYRKASDVAEEIFADIQARFKELYESGKVSAFQSLARAVNETEKKYTKTEGGE